MDEEGASRSPATETAVSPRPPPGLGRFDQSFFIRMLVSFLVFLLMVAGLELALRFGFAVWDFRDEGPENVEAAADQLADDVRSIMINSGGPVAARTVYPILDRTFERAGLQIAISPSETTVEAIERAFDFTPRGIPVDFDDGVHHEARTDLRADELCLRCHVTASVGDVLGTVTVREYRSERLSEWWGDVRLSVTLNLIKIVVNTVILFFLLRLLMAPLLSLRDAVGRLARGIGGLSVRAEVRSRDEFGELAANLNAFLDRIGQFARDLRRTLSRMVRINSRLARVSGRAEEQLERVEAALEAALAPGPVEDETGHAGDSPRAPGYALPRILREVHGLESLVQEMHLLEEQLQDVAVAGEELVARLSDREADPDEDEDPEPGDAPEEDVGGTARDDPHDLAPPG